MPLPDVVSGLLLSGRPLVRIQPGVPDFLSKALAARAFVFYPFWYFLAAHSMPSRGCALFLRADGPPLQATHVLLGGFTHGRLSAV